MGMGCCGCSLYATTITAGILTILDCVLLTAFDILLIIFIIDENNFTNNEDFKEFIKGFGDENKETFLSLLGIKVGIRVIWLISAVILFIGNAREYRKFLNVWQYITVTRIIFAIATSIYAITAFNDNLKDMFNYNKLTNHQNRKIAAKFTLLLDFVEFGPIWWLLLIALIIFIHRRGQEIDNKKRESSQVVNWSNFDSNGVHRSQTSALAHPVSLTQEPNPFVGRSDDTNDNNNKETFNAPNAQIQMTSNANDSVQPILKVNEIISIPRVTLTPNKGSNNMSNAQQLNNNDYNRDEKRFSSSLAQRSSYFEAQRNPNNIPKRNNSYNIAQTSGQRSRNYYSYDNRGYNNTENDVNKPVLIKRASVKRN